MALGNFTSNQGTQTPIIVDTIGGSVMAIQKVDISPLGADGTIWNGNVGVSSGTITTLPNIPGGSIVVTNGTVIGNGGSMIAYGAAAAAAAAAGNPVNVGGTDSGGTIRTIKVDSGGLQRIGLDSGTLTVLPNLPQGSINVTAGTIATLGTMGTLGLVNTVTTVSNLTNGSVNVTAGTIATLGTMGTLGLVNTVTTVSNLTNGSVAVIAGTVNAGTINLGTFRLNPSPTIVSNVYGTTTIGTIGTLVSAPNAGSAIIVTSLDINQQSGTAETVVSYGLAAQGNQVVERGNFVAGGGIAKTWATGVSGSATGTALTFNVLSGSGTVSINLAYFVAVP